MKSTPKITTTHYAIIGGVLLAGLGVTWYVLHSKKKKRLERQKDIRSLTTLSPKNMEQNTSASTTTVPKITSHTKTKTVTIPDWEQPFTQAYVLEVQRWLQKPIQLLDQKTASTWAKQLKEAKGIFNDNEEIVQRIFSQQLQDKTQVSTLSTVFWKTYKLDLWNYLKDFLSSKELALLVTRPVAQLPKYRLA